MNIRLEKRTDYKEVEFLVRDQMVQNQGKF